MLLNKKKAELRRMSTLTHYGQNEPKGRQQEAHLTHDDDDDERNSTEALLGNMKLVDTVDKFALKRRLSSKNLKVEKPPKTQKKTVRETMPLNSIRFNGLQHDINYDDPNEPRKGIRCKLESCGIPTTVYCEVCKVHLCFVTGKNGRNCFKQFHNLSEC